MDCLKPLALGLFTLIASHTVRAQSFSINTDGSVADTSALLDVKSTSKGVLVPRMNKTQRQAIFQPAAGLLVYQSGPDSTGFYFYDGAAWKWLSTATAAQGWNTTGNAGTTAAGNFIGTTDNIPLSFRQNNNWVGRFDAANRNYYLGGGAGASASGTSNIAFGDSAMNAGNAVQAIVIGAQAAKTNNSSGSIVIGYEAAANNTTPGIAIGYQSQRLQGAATNTSLGSFTLSSGSTGAENTAMGYNSMPLNTTGAFNTAIGSRTLQSNVSTSDHTAVGVLALNRLFHGTGSIGIGRSAMSGMESATRSIAIGSLALNGATSTDTSESNIAIGYFNQGTTEKSSGNISMGNYTMRNATRGNYNVAVGDSAFVFSTASNSNVVVGRSAGVTLYNSNENVFIGAHTGNQTPFFGYPQHNNTFIGHRSGIHAVDGANKNTFMGDSSGLSVTTGSFNTFIGAQTASGLGSISNATAIGYKAYVTESNTLILGGINGVNGSTAHTRVGIGTTAPNSNALLSVSNNFMVQASGSVQYANGVNNMIYLFESGTSNPDRMVIAHSPSFPNYGLQYQDNGEKFNFLSGGAPVMTVDLSAIRTGVNTISPNSTLHVDGSVAVGTSMGLAGGTTGSPASLANAKSYIGLSPADGTNNYYQLPDPATCSGRMYIIRNNSSVEIAKLITAGGLLFGGSSASGSADYWLNPNSAPKTVMAVSDGINWTVGRMD
jgi:trimeric autotransporter adhesin